MSTSETGRPVDGTCVETCGCATEVGGGAPPIACSLGVEGMGARVAEWQVVLADVVGRAPLPNGVRLAFGPNAPVTEIARLVDAEVSCCSFFTMTLAFDRHGMTLEVTAPDEGQPVLAALFAATG